VGNAEHALRLGKMPGLYGCIIGKALYDKTLTLAEITSPRANV
jgi:phosphoribosylformimino-5-aminoimidazole carboxamide ribonucleotide (ProFAR) isomerase